MTNLSIGLSVSIRGGCHVHPAHKRPLPCQDPSNTGASVVAGRSAIVKPWPQGAGPGEAVLYTDSQLYIMHRPQPHRVTVRLIGEVDATNHTALSRTLTQVHDGTQQVIVDVQLLRFIDSRGIVILNDFSRRGWIQLANMSPQFSRLCSIMHMTFEDLGEKFAMG
ncbi:STAS domain-containing protein [Nonomuraea sediminis]|uniref:STAS domain-containing protein n=1 Tax=Nonomuraea sediminis TaxID=2835864 RepID=UPI001BDCDD35|nr:STAS domain-containing protein [Nonomuraea sediminis]